jgi:hypothetical protein
MRWTIPLLLLFAAPPPPLAGQEPRARDGFWWGFGLGYGSYHFTCQRCDRSAGTNGISSGYLAVGVTATPRLTLGIELAGGTMENGGAVMSASLVGTCYASTRSGLFVRGGLGTSIYQQRSYVEFPPFRGTGSGWLAAVGWDLHVERGPSFTPMITYRAGAPGTVLASVDTAATNLRQRSITFTLGLTFH